MPNARAFRSQPRATRPPSRDSRRRTPRVPLTDPRRGTRKRRAVGRPSAADGARAARRGASRERHDPLFAAAQERRRQQEEAGVLLSRVVYDAVHFVPSSPERVPGRALLFESRFESGNLRRVIHVCENEYDLLLNWDHGTRGHTQWFLFAVRGAVQGESYRFNINNFCKGSSLCASPPPRGGGGGGGGSGSPLTPTRAHAAAALQLGRRAATEQPRAPRRPGIAMGCSR